MMNNTNDHSRNFEKEDVDDLVYDGEWYISQR